MTTNRVPYEIAKNLVTREGQLRSIDVDNRETVEGGYTLPDVDYQWTTRENMVTTPELLGWTSEDWSIAVLTDIENGENNA